jgi:hypothetical protein
LARLTAVQTTTTATLAQTLDVRVVARIRSLHVMAEVDQHFCDADMPMRTKWMGPISFGSFMPLISRRLADRPAS